MINKQIRGFIQKQKGLIAEAPTMLDKDYLCMMWLGYINGLRLAGAVTFKDYQDLDKEIHDYVTGADAA